MEFQCSSVEWSVVHIGEKLFSSQCNDAVLLSTAVQWLTRKGRLWRRYYYLQYIRLLYNKYKAEYER